jgi:hypothetical protein
MMMTMTMKDMVTTAMVMKMMPVKLLIATDSLF